MRMEWILHYLASSLKRSPFHRLCKFDRFCKRFGSRESDEEIQSALGSP
jgi:hypothetical protein